MLGYPDPYDLSRSSSCTGLSTADRTDLNRAANLLDGQIQAAAQRHGDVFADVRPAFAGHEICDPRSWLNSVDWLDLGTSYHPTAVGQAGVRAGIQRGRGRLTRRAAAAAAGPAAVRNGISTG